MAEHDERMEELSTLSAIFPELTTDLTSPYSASLDLAIEPMKPLLVRFAPSESKEDTYAQAGTKGAAYIEHDVELSHLPPLILQVTLPSGYPTQNPPQVRLETKPAWLPQSKLEELELELKPLWEEYSRCEILFAYINYLQDAAERGFDFEYSSEGCLVLPVTLEKELVDFDAVTKDAVFNAGTYDCGICLEPKKGSSCHQLKRCGHVFCRQCLQDFYNNAITEGDVAGIKCLSPDCGKDDMGIARRRKRRSERTLYPGELLAIGIEESMIRRYVEMKRKKKLEADKNTVYCPRTWCQGPARSTKFPSIPTDLSTYAGTESSSSSPSSSSSSDNESDVESPTSNHTSPKSTQKKPPIPPDPADRLAICEKCSLAFCRVCFMGWHGPFARCFPRDPTELSAEEKASYDYIRMNTSPCPTCLSPTQKTMGCNHMRCFQCKTHFCYLCGSWLEVANPYLHFNKPGTACYQRLWELEEGDEGQRPADGRRFGGGRMWEQLALEVAREADEAEEAQAGGGHQVRVEDDHDGLPVDVHGIVQGDAAGMLQAMEQMRIQNPGNGQVDLAHQPRFQLPNPAGRRQRNPFPNVPARGAANAVRNHERNRGGGGGGGGGGNNRRVMRRPVLNDEERQQQEIQRFLDMAQRDEEDGWDSDELGDDDEGFVIQ